MPNDVLAAAVIQSMSRGLSVADLIRTAETLKQSGQADSVEVLYSSWIDNNPDNPLLYAVLFNASVALADAGKLPAARTYLERAITLNAEFMPAYINLGRVYERQGNAGMAVMQWSAALARLAPVNGPAITHKTTALNQSARALEAANQDEAAENMLHQSLEIDCHQREVAQHLIALRQRQCEWPVIAPWERVSHQTLMTGMSPLSAAAYSDDPMLQLAIAWNYNKEDVGTPERPMISWPNCPSPGKPLRIGYLSSDLREHAVGYLMTEVLELHDRKNVEVFAYYCGIDSQDPLHNHFKASADHWTPISKLDDDAAARKIAQDGIQILVDLNGYTREARLKVLAQRPAPVIVNWLGYPGSMGSPYHHYLVADDWVVPPENELYFSEKIVRLPCYQPNFRKRAVAPIPTRPQAKLPENAFVYCCFNGMHKINRFTFDRWMVILSRVPGSVLWLLGGAESANARLRDYAAQHGIAPERILFADKLANPYHLARYALADLFLDTTPYGAHTTASDALWMSVPILTLSGRSFASRVCGSLARAAGIEEMVVSTPEEYIERAVEFGSNPSLLEPIRHKLRDGHDTCTLFNTPKLVRNLEELYAGMWSDYQNGALPQPDLANLDAYLEMGSKVKHDEVEVQSVADYTAWWREKLAARHQYRPIQSDRRLWPESAS